MESKNIFITGSAGFIGYHLASFLKKRGDFVVGLDNFNGYYSTQLKKDRAKQLKEQDIQIIEGDICNYLQLKEIISKFEITHFVHLAAQAGVRYSLENPQAYIHANIDGFLNVLELCRQNPHIFLTYASSSSVYGNNTKIPFSIQDPTENQASLYGVTKKTNELMATTYHHLFNIPVTGLRFFTVYGPWGRPDMAYYSFARAMLDKKPIDIYNLGNMQRDFTYIDDIIDGISAAINYQGSSEIFNLGNHHPESVLSLVSYLEEALKIKALINYLPMQSGDVQTTFADIEYTREKLGFIPKISLQKGIHLFVDWYKNYTHQD